MQIHGLPINKMFEWKNANLGFTLLGLFYLIFPWFASGRLNNVTAMFGMMFLAIAILRAKGSVSVLGSLFVAFLGICYFFGSISLMDINLLWFLAIVMFVGSLVFELGFIKIGKSTSSAKAFVLVPLSLISFSLILALIGKNPRLIIDWKNMWTSLNYVAILLFSTVTMLDIAGWKVAGGSTNKWIMLFAIFAIATAFMGIGQGTLWQW
jgi:hypothetical protein